MSRSRMKSDNGHARHARQTIGTRRDSSTYNWTKGVEVKGEHFPSTADHPRLLASSSLGIGSVSRIVVTLQRAQARAIHAHMARLEASPSLLSTLPSRAIISAGDLRAIAGSS